MKYWVDGNEEADEFNEYDIPALATVPGACGEVKRPTPQTCVGEIGQRAIQTLNVQGSNSFDVKYLDIATGSYEPWFSASGVSNGCDISPKSFTPYCTSFTGELARFDESTVQYVAKLPSRSFAAAFANGTDTFYFSIYDYAKKTTNIFSLPDVDSMIGYEYADDERILNYSNLKPVCEGIKSWVMDWVCLTGKFDGGEAADYLLGLHKSTAILVKVTGPSSPKVWKLKFNGIGKSGFGAAWNFQNQAYFSSNDGNGVVWVDSKTIDLESLTVEVVKVGSSVATKSNDGMNCHNAPPPHEWERHRL
jgi:hypothetical protein